MKNSSIPPNPTTSEQKPKRIWVPDYVQVSEPESLSRAEALVKLWRILALPEVEDDKNHPNVPQTT